MVARDMDGKKLATKERATKKSVKLFTVVCQEWEESERGWGVRPDGASLHLTAEDCAKYVKAYIARQPPGPAPHEYTRTSGKPFLVDVDKATYANIKAKPNKSLMIWQSEYSKMCWPDGWKPNAVNALNPRPIGG